MVDIIRFNRLRLSILHEMRIVYILHSVGMKEKRNRTAFIYIWNGISNTQKRRRRRWKKIIRESLKKRVPTHVLAFIRII